MIIGTQNIDSDEWLYAIGDQSQLPVVYGWLLTNMVNQYTIYNPPIPLSYYIACMYIYI